MSKRGAEGEWKGGGKGAEGERKGIRKGVEGERKGSEFVVISTNVYVSCVHHELQLFSVQQQGSCKVGGWMPGN